MISITNTTGTVLHSNNEINSFHIFEIRWAVSDLVKQKSKMTLEIKRWVNNKVITDKIELKFLELLIDKECCVVVDYLFTGWTQEGWKQVSWSCMLLLNLFNSSSSNLSKEIKTNGRWVKLIFESWRKHQNIIITWGVTSLQMHNLIWILGFLCYNNSLTWFWLRKVQIVSPPKKHEFNKNN